jgi:hypothetical protein
MKIIFLIPIILLLKFPQTDKLSGKYRVVPKQYEEEYVIFFNDSVYTKVFQSGKEIKGVIEYKNLIYLRDYESSLKVVGQRIIMAQTEKLKDDETISLRNAGNGVFSFCFHKLRKDGPMNWLDICQSSGEMIKAK